MQQTPPNHELVAQWMRAVQTPAIATALHAMFEATREAIASRGPACWASGRCCNFAKAGHRLYVTGLEAAWTVHHLRATQHRSTQTNAADEQSSAPPASLVRLPLLRAATTHEKTRPGQAKQPETTQAETKTVRTLTLPALTPGTLQQAVERGDCPFLVGNACGVHAIKPFACRTYFCDASSEQWQHDLTEQLHTQLRTLHEAHAIAYRYGEWRELLSMMLDAT
jgi:Fe-S-cluster containining protein